MSEEQLDIKTLFELLKQQQTVLQQLVVDRQQQQAQPFSGTSICSFQAFNLDIERWSQYVQRLGEHFEANDLHDKKKQKACLLSWVGPEN